MRCQASAAGLIQLCAELHGSGVLSSEAMQRIKDAILGELIDQAPRSVTKHAFRSEVHNRLDRAFSQCQPTASLPADASAAMLRANH